MTQGAKHSTWGVAIIGLLAVAAAWPFKADAQSSQRGCAHLSAAFELAGVRDHMVDSRDRTVVLGQLHVVASEAKGSSARALQVAGEIIATTKRPGVAAEASKAADFISQTRDAFSSCAAETGK